MLRSLRVLLATACLLVLPTRAAAWEAPGQHPATGAALELVQQAEAFWAERNVVGNCPQGIIAWQAPNLIGKDGDGRDGATCELWLSDDLVSNLTPPGNLINACTAVTHETGHALGLGHTATGVMAPQPYAWAPYFCTLWVDRELAAFWDRDAGVLPARDNRSRHAHGGALGASRDLRHPAHSRDDPNTRQATRTAGRSTT
jgi:hypothetical protein